MRFLPFIGLILMLSSCTGIPQGATPVQPFYLNRYLGTWYEIARLDHSFERGLSHVTAQYSQNPDGSVKVVNSGFNAEKNRWQTATGVAKWAAAENQGWLKVSFFRPFYGTYLIVALDEQAYQYALVVGPNTDYLWILARTPQLAPAIQQQLLAKAQALGFNTQNILFVEHSRPPATPKPSA